MKLRTLFRERGFAATVILTVAFGIAVNTVIFSIVNSVLLRPLAYRDPGKLVVIHEVIPEVSHLYPRVPVNARHYQEWRDHLSSFDGIALVQPAGFTLTGAGVPERLRGVLISPDLFAVLGKYPQAGRMFTADEAQAGRDHVVILA